MRSVTPSLLTRAIASLHPDVVDPDRVRDIITTAGGTITKDTGDHHGRYITYEIARPTETPIPDELDSLLRERTVRSNLRGPYTHVRYDDHYRVALYIPYRPGDEQGVDYAGPVEATPDDFY